MRIATEAAGAYHAGWPDALIISVVVIALAAIIITYLRSD